MSINNKKLILDWLKIPQDEINKQKSLHAARLYINQVHIAKMKEKATMDNDLYYAQLYVNQSRIRECLECMARFEGKAAKANSVMDPLIERYTRWTGAAKTRIDCIDFIGLVL